MNSSREVYYFIAKSEVDKINDNVLELKKLCISLSENLGLMLENSSIYESSEVPLKNQSIVIQSESNNQSE